MKFKAAAFLVVLVALLSLSSCDIDSIGEAKGVLEDRKEAKRVLQTIALERSPCTDKYATYDEFFIAVREECSIAWIEQSDSTEWNCYRFLCKDFTFQEYVKEEQEKDLKKEKKSLTELISFDKTGKAYGTADMCGGCPSGDYCDTSLGYCMPDTSDPCAGISCSSGEVCDPTYGSCMPDPSYNPGSSCSSNCNQFETKCVGNNVETCDDPEGDAGVQASSHSRTGKSACANNDGITVVSGVACDRNLGNAYWDACEVCCWLRWAPQIQCEGSRESTCVSFDDALHCNGKIYSVDLDYKCFDIYSGSDAGIINCIGKPGQRVLTGRSSITGKEGKKVSCCIPECERDEQCNDDNDCTIDTCNDDGVCVRENEEDEILCDDGDACTGVPQGNGIFEDVCKVLPGATVSSCQNPPVKEEIAACAACDGKYEVDCDDLDSCEFSGGVCSPDPDLCGPFGGQCFADEDDCPEGQVPNPQYDPSFESTFPAAPLPSEEIFMKPCIEDPCASFPCPGDGDACTREFCEVTDEGTPFCSSEYTGGTGAACNWRSQGCSCAAVQSCCFDGGGIYYDGFSYLDQETGDIISSCGCRISGGGDSDADSDADGDSDGGTRTKGTRTGDADGDSDGGTRTKGTRTGDADGDSDADSDSDDLGPSCTDECYDYGQYSCKNSQTTQLCVGVPGSCSYYKDSNCPDTQYCDQGVCILDPADCRNYPNICSASETCNNGNGNCENDMTHCINTPCSTGSICQSDGSCEPDPNHCLNFQCETYTTCNSQTGNCETGTDHCSIAGCPIGDICETDGSCVLDPNHCLNFQCATLTKCNTQTGNCDTCPNVCSDYGQTSCAGNNQLKLCVNPVGDCPYFKYSNCNTAHICVSGNCELDPDDCRNDASICPLTEFCNNQGVCEIDMNHCANNAGLCTGNTYCDTETGICEESPVACTRHRFCPTGKFCFGGFCTEGVNSCYTFDDCGVGEGCINGVCVANKRCVQDNQCGGDEYCDESNNYCEMTTSCSVNEDCLADEVCDADKSKCVGKCYSHADCLGEVCFEGGCFPGAECDFHSDCGPIQYCQSETGYCVGGWECSSASDDCGTGFVCDVAGGGCIPACSSNTECPTNEVCSQGICVSGTRCAITSECGAMEYCHYENMY